MGGSPFSSSDVRSYYEERTYIRSASNVQQVFKQNGMCSEFDPAKIKLPREACDSPLSPNSRGIIYAEDLTGSMGKFLLSLIQNEFPELIKRTYETVSYNPHIMFMGVGDVEYDDAPLQVTQFETDKRMLDQLQKIYVEKGGGSNEYESYILPWYFASKHVEMDCYNKRNEKGFLFTFGDELPTPQISKDDIYSVFGGRDSINSRFITATDCLKMAEEKFYCYHIILHGNYMTYKDDICIEAWRDLMGNRVCDVENHHHLPYVITSILKMHEGHSKTSVIDEEKDESVKETLIKALKFLPENIEDCKKNDENTENANIEVF